MTFLYGVYRAHKVFLSKSEKFAITTAVPQMNAIYRIGKNMRKGVVYEGTAELYVKF